MANPGRFPADLMSGATVPALAQQTVEYWLDNMQRTVLFWDVGRRRSTPK
jgi:hypothetical protein